MSGTTFAAIFLCCGQASADSTVKVSAMTGTAGRAFDDGLVHGRFYDFAAGAGPGQGPPLNLYDNIPSFLGGTGTPGAFGGFGAIGTYLFLDWDDTAAQWGDDLHQISAGGVGPAVVTGLWYGYFNDAGTSTHIIKIYDMVPPSVVPSVTSTVRKGMLLTSIVLPNQPTATFVGFSVSISGLSIALPHSSVWIKFDDAGPGSPQTMWLSGGYPGVGSTEPGVTSTVKYPPGGTYNLWHSIPYFYVDGLFAASNVTVGLNGFHVPGPPAIGLLAISAAAILRRRRTVA